MASNGGVDGFDGVDGVDDGGFDGVEWWRRMVGIVVFDTEGTDVEVPLSPVVSSTGTQVACFQSEQFAGEQRIYPCAVLSYLSGFVSLA